ncbi:MAG: hypothetical protein AAFV96_01490 [Pseudomonadota bacterium]
MSEPMRTGATQRFLLRCEGTLRAWLWLVGGGVVMAALGFVPSLFVTLALLGVVWVPILVLIFWGRLLDDLVPHRRYDDRDGEP